MAGRDRKDRRAGKNRNAGAVDQRIYDFAVIIFSQADLAAGEYLKTRDDCLFEAGLFMAAIGRNRCFLLSGVERDDLPPDLGGINLIKFTEPRDFRNFDQCRPAIQTTAAYILAFVQKDIGEGVPNRPVSHDALLKRQQLENAGGELKEDQVVVALAQPPGLGYADARHVRLNLDNNIAYVYFFQGNTDAADKIPKLLQLVLLAGFLNKQDAASFKVRADLVTAYREEIMETLKDICSNDQLNIYFLPESPELEYCIHNAISDRAARLYLKHRDDFIEWWSGPQAYRFWCAMREKYCAYDAQAPDAVFHGAGDFELNGGLFLANLETRMRRYFGDVADEVMGLCLRGPQ